MKAEIVAVGTELLLGQIANTNAQFISEQLAEIGVDVFYHTAVGDNPERLRAAVEIARSRSDVLIFTGGLGPTKDDLTKEVISEMLGRRLVIDRAALSSIEEHFKKTNRPMTENNKKQALVMEGARVLPNEKGMAPGMILETDGVIYILMPGVPSEMKAMFTNAVKPYLSSKVHEPIVSRVLRFFGIGESALETRIADLIDRQSRLTIAPLAKEGEVTLRLTVKHADAHVSQRLLDEAEAEIRARVGDYLYGYGETSLAETVFRLLRERGLTIASAESLTGGLFAERLTDLPGASAVFAGGVVSYTNAVKQGLLGVPADVLSREGAVSAVCAEEMAANIRRLTGADLAVSFTGVAGPTRSEGKEVGTVYIGLADAAGCEATLYRFAGNREAIRRRSVLTGFDLIRRRLLGLSPLGKKNE